MGQVWIGLVLLSSVPHCHLRIAVMPWNRHGYVPEGVWWQVIGMSNSGTTQSDIARTLNIHQSTVRHILVKHQRTGAVKDLPYSGRPLKTTPREDRAVRLMALRSRSKCGPALAREWSHAINKNVSAKTAKCRLKSAGLKSRRPKKGARQTNQHKANRTAFT